MASPWFAPRWMKRAALVIDAVGAGSLTTSLPCLATNLHSFAMVEAECYLGEQICREFGYDITRLAHDARQRCQAVRRHRGWRAACTE
ncbi:hypothetical protein MARPU_06240 [Marichromatium purpuratum 984]|uniref:Uncharacterized protein n=1 Tax=Marichromatium purpuratum 984 TaxID=765910 RepID=W0E3V3_MARPU|nr:hypothetical protein MARPU_06240 [Marichromatium purpuratum 984]